MSSLYEVEVSHVRVTPLRHDVRRRGYLWFVDVDDLPRRPRALAGILARDHVGDPSRSLRENVVARIAEQGFDIGAGRITMLTQARTFGYVFNPLTLFWCHDESGSLVCVVAEVHNTYGQRHAYVLTVDDAGRAEVGKEFYVSPFYPVDGYYRMSVPEPTDNLAITITLHRPGDRPFTASVRGVRRSATRSAILKAALRHPVAPLLGRLAITRHGIALWRAGLRVAPRPGELPSRETKADRLAMLFRGVAGADLPLRIRAWDGSEAGPADGPVLVIRSRRALRRILWAPGELGLARAYVTGELDVEGDLTDGFRQIWQQARSGQVARVELSARQRLAVASGALRLGAIGLPVAVPASEARLSGRRHSASRDRAAISHHYDLSNEFYGLLLDETMAYSSAFFTDPAQPLVEAQRAKLDLICRKLQLEPGMRLLDVGCGWGSLILHAAERYGVQATGVTLSAAQRDHIAKQVADRGLTDRVTVRLQDYRELAHTSQSFDAVSSIEMGEHVGQEHYHVYASVLHGALRPGGRLLLQQMSRHRGTAPGGGAFIEGYIAPDMYMRPLPETLAFLEGAGFEIRDVQAMREHYMSTVRCWIDTFEARYPHFVGLVGEEVARVWRLYLVGGALAFEEGRMGVDQILAVR